MTRLCAVDGCTKPQIARGWCTGHYQRWKKNGSPTPSGWSAFVRNSKPPNGSPQEWLEYYAIPVPEAGCWLFIGGVDCRGYGKIGVGGITTIASRASYEKFYGPIPNGLLVCHRCDVPLCINPKHLFLGTQTENLGDMYAKGRRIMTYRDQCKFGHPLIKPSWANQKICPICMRAANIRHRAKARAMRNVQCHLPEDSIVSQAQSGP